MKPEETTFSIESESEISDRVLNIVQQEYDYGARLDSVLGIDIAFDSLDAVEFTMRLEKEFDIAIPDEEMYSFDKPTKVKDIVDYILKKLKWKR